MAVGPKGLTIIAILMGLIAIFCLGLALTATERYRTQRDRVSELEERLAAGKGELLKVPQVQFKLQEEQKAKVKVEEELAGVKEEMAGLQAEFEGFKHEHELLAAAKLVADRQLEQTGIELRQTRASLASLEEKLKAQEELQGKMEKRIAELDLDARAAETRANNLAKEVEALRRENEALKAGLPPVEGEAAGLKQRLKSLQEELEETRQAKADLENRLQSLEEEAWPEIAIPEEAEAPDELMRLRAKVAELTNELVLLTKAKLAAEKEVEVLRGHPPQADSR